MNHEFRLAKIVERRADGRKDERRDGRMDVRTNGRTISKGRDVETKKEKKENCQESGNERKWRKNQCEKLKVKLDTSLHDCALYRGVR